MVWTAADWLSLGTSFSAPPFDAGILLGNSLCLLRSREDHRRVAEQVHQIIKPGGVFIVDERNFRYITESATSILAGAFRYTGRVMYCGKGVEGIPTKITPTAVTFCYRDTQTQRVLGHLEMHPFGEGEITELFEQAGFALEGLYSDLRPAASPQADFFTYVFRRN